VYYPLPLHLQPLYSSLGYKPGDFPHAEHAALEVLSLPNYPELTTAQRTRVADTVSEFLHQQAAIR
jgi:dTDP-4-amino-4,6-dideoxygalactose transaminase